MSVEAAISDGKGGFKIGTIDVGAPAPDEVKVELRASGICHTDWDSLSWGYPVVLGHEGAGVVLEVGDNVTGVAPGDHVVLNWAIPCHSCFACENGNTNICEVNSPVTGSSPEKGHAHPEATLSEGAPIRRSFHLGTLSRETIVKKEAVVVIPKAIPFESACLLGCGVMTGYGSVVHAAKVNEGSSVVVIGTGGVGLNVIQAAKVSGAGKIIAVDVKESRLEMATKFGATHSIRASVDDAGLLEAAKQVAELCGGRGADYAFECTGIPALGAAPLAMVRNAGIAVQVSGIEETIEIDMNLFEWDKIYTNPLYGKSNPAVDFPKLIELYEQGALLLDELVTRTYPLRDLSQAFDDMLAGKNAKGVIVFD
ncbi:alcohol dehydrogenase catalytic domain-containing protein [Verrucomicrobiales bacterium BCK34]|nr:alcohol dehydrogenase catalytic domain-containing protein [Verrucomicrobiales bacterium BCK34]